MIRAICVICGGSILIVPFMLGFYYPCDRCDLW